MKKLNTIYFPNKFLLCFSTALLQDRFIPDQWNFLQQMKAGQTAMAFSLKTPSIYIKSSATFCFLGGWVWTAESAQPQIFWYSCSLHPSSALVSPEDALLPGVPAAAASGWIPLSTEGSRAVLPPHLTFLHWVCKLFQVGKDTNSFVSSKLCLRTESTTICCSGERIHLYVLFPDPATNVLRILLKAFTRKLQLQQCQGVQVLPVFPRKSQHYEMQWK